MLVEDKKYRFLELMSAVSMLPSIDMADTQEAEGSEDWLFPNLTKDIADGDLRDAILCQALREDVEFKFKLVAGRSPEAELEQQHASLVERPIT